jgi:hypothetical protein
VCRNKGATLLKLKIGSKQRKQTKAGRNLMVNIFDPHLLLTFESLIGIEFSLPPPLPPAYHGTQYAPSAILKPKNRKTAGARSEQ